MCGRFVFFPDDDEERIASVIEKSLPGIKGVNQYEQIKRDIYPSQLFPVIYEDKTHPQVKQMQWGYPPASKQAKNLLINARAETAADKYTFRYDFRNRRCIIPATGFYEWSRERDQYLFDNDSGLLFLGGLYTILPEDRLGPKDKSNDKFVILTKKPNATVGRIHNRMPVLIPYDQAVNWLTDLHSTEEIIQNYSVPLQEALVQK